MQCYPISWYLAVDMQLYWAAPILLLAFTYSGERPLSLSPLSSLSLPSLLFRPGGRHHISRLDRSVCEYDVLHDDPLGSACDGSDAVESVRVRFISFTDGRKSSHGTNTFHDSRYVEDECVFQLSCPRASSSVSACCLHGITACARLPCGTQVRERERDQGIPPWE